MFGEQCVFDVLKVNIEVADKLKLVRVVISKGIDNELIWVVLIEDELNVKLLIFGVYVHG